MIITAIKQQIKRAGRYSVCVDGRYAFSLSESGLIESHLAIGQEIDTLALKELKKAAGLDKAYANALRYVALRPRSARELRDYFRRKDIDEAVAAQITERLQALGLLDDRVFARAWVANRRLLKAASKRRLVLELKQKHIAEEIIAEVLAEDDTDERSVLKELIEKKRRRYPDQQKLIHYLARQGFSFEDIKAVLKENA